MRPPQMVAMILTVLLILYPLSPGPVILYYKRMGTIPPNSLSTFYAPLGWLYDHNKTIEAAYKWYFRVWRLEQGIKGE